MGVNSKFLRPNSGKKSHGCKTPPNTKNLFPSLYESFEISYRRFGQVTCPVVLHISPHSEIPLEM